MLDVKIYTWYFLCKTARLVQASMLESSLNTLKDVGRINIYCLFGFAWKFKRHKRLCA